MAKNFVQDGKSIDFQNTDADTVFSGSVVVMGALVGIAQTDIPAGKTGAVAIEGVWKLPKDTATALNLGALAYWDTANKKIVAAAGENIVLAGVVIGTVAANTATANVKINCNIAVTFTSA
jgi:predicted RecA/RadA family phage recombinase